MIGEIDTPALYLFTLILGASSSIRLGFHPIGFTLCEDFRRHDASQRPRNAAPP